MGAGAAGQSLARFMDPESSIMKCCTLSSPPSISTGRLSVHIPSNQQQQRYLHPPYCSLSKSMNGCQSSSDHHHPILLPPLGTIETRTFPAVLTPASAMDRLNFAISELQSKQTPPSDSGIIRLQVPIKEQIEAIDWLRAQKQYQQLPRCFFSGRRTSGYPESSTADPIIGGNSSICYNGSGEGSLVSIAGLGSAVFFRHLHPFSFNDWRSIKRFLSKKCPLIRAYGAIRFDARAKISSEWEAFGSFYFMVPQILNHRLSLMSLMEVRFWPRLLRGTIPFCGHTRRRSLHFKPP